MKNKPINVLVTGGGTGGHITPLIAVVEELKKNDCDILFVGSGNELEKKVAKKYNLKYKQIFSGKFRRYFSWENLIDPFKILIAIVQAKWLLLFNRPDVIFSKGGYVGFPVVLAGWILRIPIVIHESDVMMGLANRWSVKFAKKVCVGFPLENYKEIPLDKIVYTGNPIRKEFNLPIAYRQSHIVNNKNDKPYAISHKPVILVTGGSQGSRFINQTIAAMLFDITRKYHIIHIAGKNDHEWLKKNSWPDYELYDFTDKMPEFIEKADLIISRSGANTSAEISALSKPSILIPLPSSANDHQIANAKVFEKNNAAVVLSEEGLTADSLKDIIDRLMEDKKMLREIGKNANNLSQPNSAQEIAKEILSFSKKEIK